ncbi:acetylcholinesterase-like [Tetranychus urticae]|uniref:Carboxylic ester hydrolase n=1 Tax=Tetranychus urticae TaxID=32264 RepID=T1L013_TETUR|nr:acetylcholinesterase-like [Tetranychus urticae]
MKSTSIIFLFLFILQLSHQTTSEDVEPELTLSSGSIRGTSVDFRGVKVYQFLGIPFAEPPLNELRFQKPVPKKPWNGVLSVNKWGSACMQPVFPGFNTELHLSEDCLILNVFTTDAAFQDKQNGKKNSLRPVMVWIHGGGFNFGSANTASQYDGTPITGLKDVIIVSINYRLSSLGFLHLPEAGVPGNMGLWDQQLALKWVKDNIEHFGGDPNRVTIFGESAGSMSVSAHIVSPHSKGLFKNAIIQSGSIYDLKRWAQPELAKNFLNKIGCESNDYKLCLSNYQFGQASEGLTFWPTVDGEFLPHHPEELVANHGVDPNINVLLGTVGNEGAFELLLKDLVTFHPLNPVNLTIPHAKYIIGKLFGKKLIDFYSERYLASLSADDSDAIRLAVAQALGDTILACPTYALGRDLIANGVPNVYGYVQTQKPSQAVLLVSNQAKWMANVASHADDIPMVFGHPFTKLDKFNNEDVVLSFLMIDIWTKFARDGKPPQISHREWLPWNLSDSTPYPSMVLNSNKIGLIETKSVEFCIKNWPFPLDKPYNMDFETGVYAKMEEDHDEL